MRLIITGSPGTGKTTVGKALSERLNYKIFNEKEFAIAKGIGEWDSEQDELVVPLEKLEKEVNKFFAKEKNVILEGHLLCEIKVKADFAILLTCHPEILESRLEARGYKAEKIQDNVFCEGIEYCKKHLARNQPKKKIIELQIRKTKPLDQIVEIGAGLGGYIPYIAEQQSEQQGLKPIVIDPLDYNRALELIKYGLK